MVQLASRVPSVRRAALVASIAGILSILAPAWNFAQTLVATTSTHPLSKWWIIAEISVLCLFVPIMPVFYFALYRNEGTLRIPKRLRLLSAAAAFVFGIMFAPGVPVWIRSLESFWTVMKTVNWRTGATSILTVANDPRMISPGVSLVAAFANVAYILLLIALSRHATEESAADIAASTLFRLVTKVAFIAWGIWLIIIIGRVILTPYAYFQTRDYAYQVGVTPPRLSDMMVSIISTLLNQACIFAAPYIVYQAQRQDRPEPG